MKIQTYSTLASEIISSSEVFTRHDLSPVIREDSAPYRYPGPQLNPALPVKDSGRRYSTSKKPIGPEAILHVAWRNAGLERAQIRGRDGHTYRIVYGGKPGGSLGPDFTDAVVERDDGTVFRGDIEIHVREADWRAHGHHTDPRYNGVVLHVVAAESKGKPALKATGSTIPLLALNWKRPAPDPNAKQSTCKELPGTNLKASMLLELGAAGLERFHSQAAGIALDIESFGADQAIWLGIVGALGYPRNKRAFRTLATRVNWEIASKCANPAELEALLMWAAGFLGSKSSVKPTIPQLNVAKPPPEWVKPWGRPANSPTARIKAISALVPLWTEHGGIAEICARWVKTARKPVELAEMFRPPHLIENPGTTVIGTARAAEIIVNIVLPAAFALATRSSTIARSGSHANDLHLKNRALALYDSHPKLAENSLTKEAKIALGVDYMVPKYTTARDQQGLLALYREMFRRGIKPRQPRLPGV